MFSDCPHNYRKTNVYGRGRLDSYVTMATPISGRVPLVSGKPSAERSDVNKLELNGRNNVFLLLKTVSGGGEVNKCVTVKSAL